MLTDIALHCISDITEITFCSFVDSSRSCRGFGYVTFVIPEDAIKAQNAGITISGRTVLVSIADKKPRQRDNYKQKSKESSGIMLFLYPVLFIAMQIQINFAYFVSILQVWLVAWVAWVSYTPKNWVYNQWYQNKVANRAINPYWIQGQRLPHVCSSLQN